MKELAALINQIDDFLWDPTLVVLLLGTHLFMTIYLKGIQRYTKLGIRLSVRSTDASAQGEISPFGALSIALAATLGTGNIIGVSTAIVCGGPGAVFWCWLCGVLGIATKYAEGVLSLKYRVLSGDGAICGGPMYAMQYGMKCKWLGILFAVFTLIASFGIGNMTQSNAIAGILKQSMHCPEWITGTAVMLAVTLSLCCGLKSISKISCWLTPFIIVLYVLGCVSVIIINFSVLPKTFQLIFQGAFSMKAVSGGFLGSVMMMALRYGVARGLFSNESGMGSAPLIAASAKTINPVRQALISATGTFWDTVIICALTGITVVSSVLKLDANPDFAKWKASELVFRAFDQIPWGGRVILSSSLLLFCYTTLIGWFCYGRQAAYFLAGKKFYQIYRGCFLLLILPGALLPLQFIWNFSDIANGLMAIPNILSLLFLCKIIKQETAKYLWSGNWDGNDPECCRINARGRVQNFEDFSGSR